MKRRVNFGKESKTDLEKVYENDVQEIKFRAAKLSGYFLLFFVK